MELSKAEVRKLLRAPKTLKQLALTWGCTVATSRRRVLALASRHGIKLELGLRREGRAGPKSVTFRAV